MEKFEISFPNDREHFAILLFFPSTLKLNTPFNPCVKSCMLGIGFILVYQVRKASNFWSHCTDTNIWRHSTLVNSNPNPLWRIRIEDRYVPKLTILLLVLAAAKMRYTLHVLLNNPPKDKVKPIDNVLIVACKINLLIKGWFKASNLLSNQLTTLKGGHNDRFPADSPRRIRILN